MLLAAECMAVGPSGGAAQAAEPGRGTGILNVQVSHGDATAYGQPALAVNPRNPRNLLGAAWTSDNAEEAFSSFDEGRTWRDNGPLPLPAGVSFSRYRIGRWHEPTSYRSGVRSAILPGMRPSTSSSSGTVRAVNWMQPPARRIRVLLGQLPITMAQVLAQPANKPLVRAFASSTPLNAHYAAVVEREVLRKGRRALLIAGGGHVLRGLRDDSDPRQLNAVSRLALRHPRSVFVIDLLILPPGPQQDALAQRVQATVARWPRPALASLAGTWLGATTQASPPWINEMADRATSAAAAMRLAPNQAAHLTYNMAVTPSTDQGSAAAHDKAGSALQSTQKLQNSLSADVWVQADANGDPTMSAQTLTPGRPGLRGIGDRYIQIGQRVYAYDSSHNAILVTAGPGMQDFHPSWVVPNDALDGAGLTQELSALAQRSPQQVQLLPRQTLDGTTVDVIQINGWSDRPAQRTTFYFDAQSFLLRGFDAASFDSSYPTPSWQVRLTGYNTVAGSAVPANTFTLNAPADARIVAPAPDLSAFSTVCHSSADAKQVLAGTQSLLAACRATAPAVSEDDLVAALISPYKTALDSAVADGQITQAQAAHSFAAQQQWLDSFVTAPGGSAQGQSGRQ